MHETEYNLDHHHAVTITDVLSDLESCHWDAGSATTPDEGDAGVIHAQCLNPACRMFEEIVEYRSDACPACGVLG
jgi:hypothetical protein